MGQSGLPSPRRITVSTHRTSAARTATTTSPGPATGSGASRGIRTSGPPNRSTTTCCTTPRSSSPRLGTRAWNLKSGRGQGCAGGRVREDVEGKVERHRERGDGEERGRGDPPGLDLAKCLGRDPGSRGHLDQAAVATRLAQEQAESLAAFAVGWGQRDAHHAPNTKTGIVIAMIELKTASEVDACEVAGKIVADVLTAVRAHAAPGVTTGELDALAADLVADTGARPSFLGYHPSWAPMPYPGVICTSVNDAVVHGVPGRERLRQGDIMGVDLAVHLDGWCADAAFTTLVGGDDPEDAELIETAERALAAGIAAAVPGARMGDIAHAIGSVARAGGYGLVDHHGGARVGRAGDQTPH